MALKKQGLLPGLPHQASRQSRTHTLQLRMNKRFLPEDWSLRLQDSSFVSWVLCHCLLYKSVYVASSFFSVLRLVKFFGNSAAVITSAESFMVAILLTFLLNLKDSCS